MADAEAEEAFLNSMQAANEDAGGDDNPVGEDEAMVEQIESSDEYDPATLVQDTSLPASSDAVLSTHTHNAAGASTTPLPQSASSYQFPTASAMDGAVEETPLGHSAAPDATVTFPPENAEKAATNSRPTSSAQKQTSDSSAAKPAAQKIRLPHDTVGILEDRIEEDPKGDIDAWFNLIDEHKNKSRIDEARKIYERFFEVFPTAAEQWAAYIKFEDDFGMKATKERVLQSALKHAPDSLPLWTTYLDHVRRYFPIHVGENSQIVHRAFQAVIEQIGVDKDSGNIWTEYIAFLKSGPGVIGGTSWVDGQKMDQLRKAYHQAICVPTSSLESIWKEYSAFEQNLNRMTARKFIADRSPDYITARSSNVELNKITQQLRRTTVPRLPPALGFDGDVEFMAQVEIWKKWIQWEKDDPLVLKESSNDSYKKRVLHAYKQALMALRFWPEMWFEAAEFCYENDMKSDKAEDKSLGTELLNSGITANPESCLLSFKLADHLEVTTTNGNDEASKVQRCSKVRQPFDSLLDTLYGLYEKSISRERTELARVEAEFLGPVNDVVNGEGNEDDHQSNGTPPSTQDNKKQHMFQMVKAMNDVQVTILSQTITSVWIALMRAVQRMQGKGEQKTIIKGSRGIFLEARKRGRFNHELWIAAALLEYHANSDSITANKLFDRGVRLNANDEKLALAYIQWLTSVNDHTNARVIFEKAIKHLSSKPETLNKTKVLYAYFHRYETQYGELAQATKLEARMRESFPNDIKMSAFSQRFVQEVDRFDPTAIRPLISPKTQAKPKLVGPPTTVTEPFVAQPSPPPPAALAQITNSPKRPLPLDDFDAGQNPPRKIARGESPLAGAAGRRLDQLKRTRQPFDTPQPSANAVGGLPPPPPPPLPRDVLFLLSIIPSAAAYPSEWATIPPDAVVKLMRDTNIPDSVQHLPPHTSSAIGSSSQYGQPPPMPYAGNVSYQR